MSWAKKYGKLYVIQHICRMKCSGYTNLQVAWEKLNINPTFLQFSSIVSSWSQPSAFKYLSRNFKLYVYNLFIEVIFLINIRIIMKLLKSKPSVAEVTAVGIGRSDNYLLIVSEGDWWSDMMMIIVGKVNNLIVILLAGDWW